MFKANLLGNICGKPTRTHLFPYKVEKEGVTANIVEEACRLCETKENQLGCWSSEAASGRPNLCGMAKSQMLP